MYKYGTPINKNNNLTILIKIIINPVMACVRVHLSWYDGVTWTVTQLCYYHIHTSPTHSIIVIKWWINEINLSAPYLPAPESASDDVEKLASKLYYLFIQ